MRRWWPAAAMVAVCACVGIEVHPSLFKNSAWEVIVWVPPVSNMWVPLKWDSLPFLLKLE